MADRPDRSRAWGVLAVTLALMALVAALSSTTSHAPIEPAAASAAHRTADPRPNGRATINPHHGTRRSGRSGGQSRQPGSSATAHVTSTGAGGTGDGPSLATGGSTASGAGTAGGIVDATVSAGTASAEAPDAELAPSNRSAAPTTPATTSPPASNTDAGAATDPSPPSTTGASSTETGAIGPGASASFAARGGGPVSAEATWTGATTLELGISCPDGVSSARTGVSGLSVEVDDTYGAGTCTVTLALAPGQTGTADYRVSVEPAA